MKVETQMQVLWMLVIGSGGLVEAGRGRKGWRRQDLDEAPGVAVASDPFALPTATPIAMSTIASLSSDSAVSASSTPSSVTSIASASSAVSSASATLSTSISSTSGSISASSVSSGSSSAASTSSATSSSTSASASASAPAKPAIDPNNTEDHPGGMVFMTPIFALVGLTLFYWIWEKRRQQRIAKASAGLTFSPYRKKKPGAKEWKPIDSEDEDEKARAKDRQARHWKSKTPITPLPPTKEEGSSGEEGHGPYTDRPRGRRSHRPRRDKDFPDAYEDEYDGEIYHDPGTLYFGAPDDRAGPGAPVTGFANHLPPQQGLRVPLGPHDYRTLPTEDDLADVLVRPASRHGSSCAPSPGPPRRGFLAPPGAPPPPLERTSSGRSQKSTHRRHTHDEPERQHRSRHGREYASHDQDPELGLGMERRRSHAGHSHTSHSRAPVPGRAASRRATADPSRPTHSPGRAHRGSPPQETADAQPANLRPRATSPTAILSPPTNPALFFQPGLSTTTVNALAMAQAVPSMTDLALSSEDEKGLSTIPSTAEKLLAFGDRITAQELRKAENPFSAAKEAQYGVTTATAPQAAAGVDATPPAPAPLAKRGTEASPLAVKRSSRPRSIADGPPQREPSKRAPARPTSPPTLTPIGRTDSTQPLKKASGKAACPTPPPSEFRRPSPSPAPPIAKKVSKRQKEVASPAKSVRRKKSISTPSQPAGTPAKAKEDKVVESWSSGATVGVSESPRAMSPVAPAAPPAPPPLPTSTTKPITRGVVPADRRKSVASPLRGQSRSRPVTPTAIGRAVSPPATSPRTRPVRGGDSPNVEEAAAAAAVGIEQRLAMIRKLEHGNE